jgi:hypothetical protein
MTSGTGVYAYCLGKVDHPRPAGVQGMGGLPVRSEPAGVFSVWVSDLDRAPQASLAAIRVHNQVVEAATATATPLPFRFGHWVGSLDGLVASLEGDADRFTRQLDHVHNALEHGVRVVDPAHQVVTPDRSSGTAYMETLAQRAHRNHLDRTRGRDVAAALRAWLHPLIRDERVRLVGGGTLAAIAYLVDRHDTGNYERRVGEFPAEWPELRFLFTGPWPPYGFVE